MRLVTINIFLLLFSQFSFCQTNYYQDIFHGGITGSGYSPTYAAFPFSGIIQLPPIPNGSTIRKAILFVCRIGEAQPIQLMFNGGSFTIDYNSLVTQPFNSPVYGGGSGIHTIEVTNYVSISQNLYTISSSNSQNNSSNRFSDFYLLVMYDNPLLSKVGCSILLNNQDFNPVIYYNPININPIDMLYDVGLSLSSGYICNDLSDGERAFVNNIDIGEFGGSNPNSADCGGPFGNFLYQDGVFTGYNGSDPTLGFNSYNVIKTINSLLDLNSTIDLRYESIDNNNSTNSIWINKLLYSTTCDTFSVSIPTDTVICKGEDYQLNVIGGQSYNWFPSIGLSCANCSNPVFSADSTMNYTVQIWNNDSCSIIKNLRIRVENCAQINELNMVEKKHIKTIDLLGRETENVPNAILIYIYSDGTTEKVLRIEN